MGPQLKKIVPQVGNDFLYSLFHGNSIKKSSELCAAYMEVFTLQKLTWYECSQFVHFLCKKKVYFKKFTLK